MTIKAGILGLLAFLPLAVYLILLTTFFSPAFFHNGAILNSQYLPFLVFAVPLVWGTLIYYIIHAHKNEKISERSKKFIWILALIFAGIITLPIYWYKYIRST